MTYIMQRRNKKTPSLNRKFLSTVIKMFPGFFANETREILTDLTTVII